MKELSSIPRSMRKKGSMKKAKRDISNIKNSKEIV